jgi:dsDNA-binding SOS-regulon protein
VITPVGNPGRSLPVLNEKGGYMPFYQEKQKVGGNQYNAEGDMYIGSVQNVEELDKLLENLKQQLDQARQQGNLAADISTDAEELVDKALKQAKKPTPNKMHILKYLNAAKSIVEGVAAASGIVTTLVQAVEAVQKIF